MLGHYFQGTQKQQADTHHGPPEVPVAQRGALLVPILEGKHNQNQVAANAVKVAFDGLPDRLIQCIEWCIAHAAASPAT